MKHTAPITFYLLLLFICSQVVGLFVTGAHLPHLEKNEEGSTIIIETDKELAFGTERMETNSAWSTLLVIIGAVLVGTLLMLVLIKYKQKNILIAWFFLAVAMCITYSLATFMFDFLALLLGIVLAYFKVIRHNSIVHNITEILIYGALGAIFIPMQYMTVSVSFVLLIIISLYDIYAVWKSKHMIKLANFQTDAKIFSGLMIKYDAPNEEVKTVKKTAPKHTKHVEQKVKTAILGGGDIAFPLLFSGTLLKELLVALPIVTAYALTFITSITTAAALLFLFLKAEKGKFYPAMPFVTAGCFFGYFIVMGLLTILP
ncbi:hypothetical protein H6504_01875 [Candidatus Woesearchaeota archaeon]|nr:hypothetical protein [Candidatus Woesearchaeota archaeon]